MAANVFFPTYGAVGLIQSFGLTALIDCAVSC
jgi:hypothetical protein